MADHKLQQIQADLGDMRQGSEDIEFKYMFIAIDIFSKYIVGLALKGKTQSDLKQALEYTIAKFGNFEELFTDTEGGLQSRTVVRLLNEHNIHHISTYGKTPFAEKAIHTIKMMIHSRLDGLKMDKAEWVTLLPKVIDKHNNRTIHSTIKMTPADATTFSTQFKVWINIMQKARYNKLYEKLGKGDLVRTIVPKKTFTKDHHPKFSTQVYIQ